MSGCECWGCWLGNEWAEVKTGSGPSERVTELDGGGFYQLCALWCLLNRLPFAVCLPVFTALRCWSLAASIFQSSLNASFFGSKISSRDSGFSKLGLTYWSSYVMVSSAHRTVKSSQVAANASLEMSKMRNVFIFALFRWDRNCSQIQTGSSFSRLRCWHENAGKHRCKQQSVWMNLFHSVWSYREHHTWAEWNTTVVTDHRI